ncbi:MAG TPA: sigma-70 family RNA polymerase sigma factor [Polyangiales bacterium]|nr:sigma-70 family RNA polymerase sigma factor [Polyangiales bacterium]
MTNEDAAASFDPLRPRLRRIAYRMLGSVADAEDVVQEAFLRWHATDREAVREPAGFLVRVVTRLCLDVAKSAQRQRTTYTGTWLPEPIVENEESEIDDVTLPLLLALERLSPLERAAFLLHDVFGVEFDEIAATLGREQSSVRQLAVRAREHVRAERPRYPLSKQRGMELASAFFSASRDGDMQALRSMLAADVVVQSDGGGKRSANLTPIQGYDAVLALHERLAGLFAAQRSQLLRVGFINGLPGFVSLEGDGLLQTTALEIRDGKIAALYIVRNPDKLRHLLDSPAIPGS